MTTVPPALLADLNDTSDPRRRAARLNDLADAHELTGLPTQARLLRLVAATETMLDNPDAEPDDDPAWEESSWWQLAGTSNRSNRADLLESIWRDWALTEVGDEDADILLQIADTERHAPTLTTELDDVFDIEAGRADMHARARRPWLEGDTRLEDAVAEPVERGHLDRAAAGSPPSTALRDTVARSAKYVGAALAMAVPVLLVVAPQAPWQLKMASGAAAFIAGLGWVGWTLWRGLDR